jgi:peroxiredoxin Q/BCP
LTLSRRSAGPGRAFALFLALAGLAIAGGAVAGPEAGDPAPAFRLQDQAGAWHSLGDYRGQWLVLYFYPKDGTPGCTTQACELRDNIFAFRRAGAVIVGISVDDVAAHRRFADEHHLPFTILADADKQTARAYGVVGGLLGFFGFAQRDTFIIDPQGRIVKHFAKVDPKGHSELVLKALAEAQARTRPAPG